MGTTLTGTTPQDTYDSLIKVTDNGPLSGTAKYLSDGLGNDSVLALSNARVGIGTTSPDTALDVNGGSKFRGSISGFGGAEILLNAGNNSQVAISTNGTGTTEMYFDQRGTATGIWRFRDTADTRMSLTSVGLGIGTDAPASKLTVDGVIRLLDGSLTGTGGVELSSEAGFGFAAQAGKYKLRNANNTATYISVDSDGLKFNGDTAAANALDDYEEGTWTIGVSFGGASVGVTTSVNSGTYTKIGRQVTVNGYLILTSKGSSVGNAQITGLPFTIGTSDGNYGAASLRLLDISFANQFQGIGLTGSTSVALQEITEAGVGTSITDSDFQNVSRVIISLTYFV